MTTLDVDVAILGAGTAGMAAYREAVKYTDRIALIDGGSLGTTCARVGCMPSKLLIAAAEAKHRSENMHVLGLPAQNVYVDSSSVMSRVRSERDRFVGFVLDAIYNFNQDHIIRHNAAFEDDNTLLLENGDRVESRAIVIATGSRPNIPPFFQEAGDRLIVNDDIFDWEKMPNSIAVFGAGVIGLELGQALHRLDVKTHLFGRDHNVGPLSDPTLVDYAAKHFSREFPAHWHANANIRREGDHVVVTWDGDDRGEERFDFLLAATGRRANVDNIGLERTSLERDARGVPIYDPQSMRAGESNIFIAGDSTVDAPLLHEAADEGRIAGENAALFPESYRRTRRTPLGIVFSDPQIGIAGASYRSLKEENISFATGDVSFEDQGRARVMGVNHGLLHVYGEHETGLLLGAEIFGPAAEHMAHMLAWAIESKQTVQEVLERPFYHPVVEEGLRTALRHLNHELGFGPNPPLRCIDCGPGG